MEGLKQQLVEVENQRDEHNGTIGKLRQVTGESETSQKPQRGNQYLIC